MNGPVLGGSWVEAAHAGKTDGECHESDDDHQGDGDVFATLEDAGFVFSHVSQYPTPHRVLESTPIGG